MSHKSMRWLSTRVDGVIHGHLGYDPNHLRYFMLVVLEPYVYDGLKPFRFLTRKHVY